MILKKRWSILFLSVLLLLSVVSASAQKAGGEQRIVFDKPIGQATAGPAGRYQAFLVYFKATPGDKLSFVTKQSGSADSFFAPDENGIPLFNSSGTAQTGPLNDKIYLWDAGTSPQGTVTRQWQNNTTGQLWVWLNYVGNNEFALRIETLSSEFTLSPGVVAIHRGYAPLFKTGQAASSGLRQLAENGSPNGLRTASVGQSSGKWPTGGVWTPQPVPAATPQPPAAPSPQNSGGRVTVFGNGMEPIGPRQHVEFTLQARPGDQLTLITSLLETNDFYFSTNEWGIALYDANGRPRTIAATKFINMWDAGTEVNEEPSRGKFQPARQPWANSGAADPDNRVRRGQDDFGPFPIGPVEQIIDVFIRSEGNDKFTVRIRNVSGGRSLSPGIALLHRDHAPVFLTNAPDRGLGLEALAEDGNPYPLATSLRQKYR